MKSDIDVAYLADPLRKCLLQKHLCVTVQFYGT
jgi:hypothetical protein